MDILRIDEKTIKWIRDPMKKVVDVIWHTVVKMEMGRPLDRRIVRHRQKDW